MKKEFLIIVILTIPANSLSADDNNQILLKSRHFIPQRGITSAAKSKIEAIPGKAHVLIQLENKPTIEDINQLESKGIKLLSYIPNKSWVASIPSNKTTEVASLSNVRSVSEILPEDKISPHIRSGNIFQPRVRDGKTLFIVEFFEDVSTADIEQVIARHNGLIKGWIPSTNTIVGVFSINESIAIASEEGVKWIEQDLPLLPTNNGIRQAIAVDAVQSPPYNLTGAGVNVLVYDVGLVDKTHSDFGDRVIWGEGDSSYIDSHSTHVAGTLGGSGALSGGTYRGMAPAVNIISYYWGCCDNDPCTIWLIDDYVSLADLDANFTEGIVDYGADIGTASIGFPPAYYGEPYCHYEGDYSAYAQHIDSIIRNRHIPITWAAANERGYGTCGTTYNTISPTATAKNAIVVGATNSNDNSMTSFSSWGPTDDGRIKPDIVAPGCENDPNSDRNDPNKTIWSTWPSQSYYGYCGTSMATPAVAGSIALMLEHWRKTHTGQPDPWPSTVKAILIQTAFDLGNPGPDYAYGYGRVVVNDAINLISENTIKEYQSDYPVQFIIDVPQNNPELKITLVWDDTPGELLADPALVHDLNLIVTDPQGTRHYPWILDPCNPAVPAARGEDHLNNVEQVSVDNPVSGTWTIEVNGDIYGGQNLFSVVWGLPKFFIISKADDVNDGDSVLPGDTITYTINYGYPREYNIGDINNVNIIDYLPEEVDPNDPCDPNYDPVSHTYRWDIGTLSPGDANSFTLKVKVNELAEPLGTITNLCAISADGIRPDLAVEITDVNAWNPPVIYVDADAPGTKTGMSWKNAYLDLQKALDKAGIGCGSQIWVAAGTYEPCIPSIQSTFQLVAGVPIYGHFAGNETALWQRNLRNLDNETILSGEGEINRFNYVVTASNLSQGAILDGFTIKDASAADIKIEKANLEVKNCLITGSVIYGIVANYSNFTITGCNILNNSSYGINTLGSSFTISDCNIHNNSLGIYSNFDNNTALPEIRITNNIIRNNVNYGIELYNININSRVLVANNFIHNNNNCGIYVHSSWSPNLTIRNNTIVSNGNYGIYGFGLHSSDPNVRNCIIWGNEPNEVWTFKPTFCCIKGGYTGTGNISSDPCFTYPDNNDFHLKPASECIDNGDPCFNDFNDRDIDGECRISFGKTALRVDMGADELYWPKADFDKNDIVNFIDFALLALDWQEAISPRSLDIDSDVDIYDLAQFCDDWLWLAPWSPLYPLFENQFDSGGMGMGAESLVESLDLDDEMYSTSDIEESATSDEASNIEPFTVEELVDWLDDIWQTGELTMNEQEYLEFRSALLKSAE
jgi:hypothetical protein